MAETGLLLEVKWEWDGTVVFTTAASVGATGLVLEDASALSENATVWLGETGPYTLLSLDEDTDAITFSPGLIAAAEEGDPAVPDVGGVPGRVWVAVVLMPDNDEPIEVPLTVHDLSVMPEGTYDPPVAITISDDLQEVIDLPGSLPTIPGEFIPIDSLPPPVLSDGEAPPYSPQPEVIPGIGAFFVRWTPPPNDDPMTFEVHISDDVVAGTGFVPSADTLYTTVAGYSATVRTLASIDTETGLPFPLEYTTETDDGDHPYYFKIIAKDVDDAAPAGSGTEARLLQITGGDVRVNSIVGENIAGTTITGDKFAGTLVMGSTITTGALDDDGNIVGARIELGPSGLTVTDGVGGDPIFYVPLTALDSAKMRANFDMLSATVQNDFTMFGQRNQIAVGAQLALSSGVTAPSETVTPSWSYDTIQFDKTTQVSPQNSSFGNLGKFALDPSQITSMFYNSVWASWEVVQQKSGGFRVWHFDTSGNIYINFGTGKPWVDDYEDRTNATGAFGTGSGATLGEATLFLSGGVWYFWGPTEINRIPDSWILDVDSRPPVLGFDTVSNQWLIAQSSGGGNGVFHVRRFSVNHYSGTGAFPNASSISTFSGEAASGLGKRPNGFYYGAGDSLGGNRYVWTVEDYTSFYVFNTSGTLLNDSGTYEMWTSPAAKQGFAYDGTAFASIDSQGLLTKYTTWNWTTTDSVAWLGLSAYDSDTATVTPGTTDSGPYAPHTGQTAGQHETPVGTLTSVSLRRRAKLTLTVPRTQDSGGTDDPDKWKVYWSKQASKPTLASQLKYAGQAGSPSATSSFTITTDPTGVAPPGGIGGTVGALNNFPGGVPAIFASASSDTGGAKINLKGDGSGRAGPLQWNTDAEVTVAPMPIGGILLSASGTVPTTFLECNGQAVSRTTYAKLFAAISTTYGVGDGSTTFNVPDLIRRLPVGRGGGISLGRNEGIATASASTRTFAHSHTINSTGSGHTHNIPGQAAGASVSAGSAAGSAPSFGNWSGHAHGGDTGSSGSGHTHGANNSSFDDIPTLCLAYYIKALHV